MDVSGQKYVNNGLIEKAAKRHCPESQSIVAAGLVAR